jgi:hypothetical protein
MAEGVRFDISQRQAFPTVAQQLSFSFGLASVNRSGFVPGQLYYTYLSMAAAFSIPAASIFPREEVLQFQNPDT